MSTAIIGGTSGVGKQIVLKYLKSKEKISLICRDPKTAKTDIFSDYSNSNYLEILKGDITDSKSYSSYLKNFKNIYCTVGSKMKKDVIYVDGEGTREFVKNCFASGVGRFLLLSSSMATRTWAPMACMLNCIRANVLKVKRKSELYLQDKCENCEGEYIIVRPPGLQDGVGGYKMFLQQGDKIFAPKGGSFMIKREDVAEACVQVMKSKRKNVVFECYASKSVKGGNNWEDLLSKLISDKF